MHVVSGHPCPSSLTLFLERQAGIFSIVALVEAGDHRILAISRVIKDPLIGQVWMNFVHAKTSRKHLGRIPPDNYRCRVAFSVPLVLGAGATGLRKTLVSRECRADGHTSGGRVQSENL